MIGVSTEALATDDHVIATVFGRLLAVVGPFGPRQHVEEGHDVHAASQFGGDVGHKGLQKKAPFSGAFGAFGAIEVAFQPEYAQ